MGEKLFDSQMVGYADHLAFLCLVRSALGTGCSPM